MPLVLFAGGAASRDALASAGTFAIGETVEVATDALNLRDAAGLDANILTVLPQHVVGTIQSRAVQADGYTWYQITVNMVGTGWVAGDFLQPYGGDEPQGLRLVVIDGPLNLRDAPSLSGNVILSIPTGATMTVTQADGGTWADGYHWIAVRLETPREEQGFVADVFTAPVDDV
jgi:uncharacterized protein YgiM (DUF1202 family)